MSKRHRSFHLPRSNKIISRRLKQAKLVRRNPSSHLSRRNRILSMQSDVSTTLKDHRIERESHTDPRPTMQVKEEDKEKGIRTRLSTGTLIMAGTSTSSPALLASPQISPTKAAQNVKTSPTVGKVSLKRKHSIGQDSEEEIISKLPPKKKKIGRNDGSGEDNKNDYFCWLCHKEGHLICCELCPRVYHTKCLITPQNIAQDWVCPECEKIMQAECTDTRSEAMAMISVDTLCTLLRYALDRMKAIGTSTFEKPVDPLVFPNYSDYVFHPICLSQLEKNIRRKMYGSTEAFLADAKWIVHNSYVYNGAQSEITSAAKSLLKVCKHELNEIEVCPDCYLNSCVQRHRDWFCEPCPKSHPIVWAKLKGYPFWPAKVLREANGQVDVRFFGAHDRSWVSVSACFMLSKESPHLVKKTRSGMDLAMKEVKVHIQKLREKFGKFEYAAHHTPYNKENVLKQLNSKAAKSVQLKDVPKEQSGNGQNSEKTQTLGPSKHQPVTTIRSPSTTTISLPATSKTPITKLSAKKSSTSYVTSKPVVIKVSTSSTSSTPTISASKTAPQSQRQIIYLKPMPKGVFLLSQPSAEQLTEIRQTEETPTKPAMPDLQLLKQVEIKTKPSVSSVSSSESLSSSTMSLVSTSTKSASSISVSSSTVSRVIPILPQSKNTANKDASKATTESFHLTIPSTVIATLPTLTPRNALVQPSIVNDGKADLTSSPISNNSSEMEQGVGHEEIKETSLKATKEENMNKSITGSCDDKSEEKLDEIRTKGGEKISHSENHMSPESSQKIPSRSVESQPNTLATGVRTSAPAHESSSITDTINLLEPPQKDSSKHAVLASEVTVVKVSEKDPTKKDSQTTSTDSESDSGSRLVIAEDAEMTQSETDSSNKSEIDTSNKSTSKDLDTASKASYNPPNKSALSAEPASIKETDTGDSNYKSSLQKVIDSCKAKLGIGDEDVINLDDDNDIDLLGESDDDELRLHLDTDEEQKEGNVGSMTTNNSVQVAQDLPSSKSLLAKNSSRLIVDEKSVDLETPKSISSTNSKDMGITSSQKSSEELKQKDISKLNESSKSSNNPDHTEACLRISDKAKESDSGPERGPQLANEIKYPEDTQSKSESSPKDSKTLAESHSKEKQLLLAGTGSKSSDGELGQLVSNSAKESQASAGEETSHYSKTQCEDSESYEQTAVQTEKSPSDPPQAKDLVTTLSSSVSKIHLAHVQSEKESSKSYISLPDSCKTVTSLSFVESNITSSQSSEKNNEKSAKDKNDDLDIEDKNNDEDIELDMEVECEEQQNLHICDENVETDEEKGSQIDGEENNEIETESLLTVQPSAAPEFDQTLSIPKADSLSVTVSDPSGKKLIMTTNLQVTLPSLMTSFSSSTTGTMTLKKPVVSVVTSFKNLQSVPLLSSPPTILMSQSLVPLSDTNDGKKVPHGEKAISLPASTAGTVQGDSTLPPVSSSSAEQLTTVIHGSSSSSSSSLKDQDVVISLDDDVEDDMSAAVLDVNDGMEDNGYDDAGSDLIMQDNEMCIDLDVAEDENNVETTGPQDDPVSAASASQTNIPSAPSKRTDVSQVEISHASGEQLQKNLDSLFHDKASRIRAWLSDQLKDLKSKTEEIVSKNASSVSKPASVSDRELNKLKRQNTVLQNKLTDWETCHNRALMELTEAYLQEKKKDMASAQQRAEQYMREELAKAKKELEKEHVSKLQNAVAEIKKKQWCAECWKEAVYYCCWNTSYCSYHCQQKHWPSHLPTCMQAHQQQSSDSTPVSGAPSNRISLGKNVTIIKPAVTTSVVSSTFIVKTINLPKTVQSSNQKVSVVPASQWHSSREERSVSSLPINQASISSSVTNTNTKTSFNPVHPSGGVVGNNLQIFPTGSGLQVSTPNPNRPTNMTFPPPQPLSSVQFQYLPQSAGTQQHLQIMGGANPNIPVIVPPLMAGGQNISANVQLLQNASVFPMVQQQQQSSQSTPQQPQQPMGGSFILQNTFGGMLRPTRSL